MHKKRTARVEAPEPEIVWLVGRVIPSDSMCWECVGIFASEGDAVAACYDRKCFVGAAVLGQAFPHETVAWPGSYYPLAADRTAPSQNGCEVSPAELAARTVAAKAQSFAQVGVYFHVLHVEQKFTLGDSVRHVAEFDASAYVDAERLGVVLRKGGEGPKIGIDR